MAHFTLKSIHPVNLLSFCPDTEPIEVRPLNIMIGSNGSGKSNFIEAIRLLHFLPDKDPWSSVLAMGGVGEWIWKGRKERGLSCSLRAEFSEVESNVDRIINWRARSLDFQITLESHDSTFRVQSEALQYLDEAGHLDSSNSRFCRDAFRGELHPRSMAPETEIRFNLSPDRSILSQLASSSVQSSGLGSKIPEAFLLAEYLEGFDFHQDWQFGVDCPPRDPPLGGRWIQARSDAGALSRQS